MRIMAAWIFSCGSSARRPAEPDDLSSDQVCRLPQCFPAELWQVAWVVDEHRWFDADGREALFPLLGEGFHGLAEVGDPVAGGVFFADAATTDIYTLSLHDASCPVVGPRAAV